MIEDVLAELKQATERAKEALRRELAKLRTGRAHAGMLDSLRVEYYGSITPVAQMATVNVPEPRMITVKAWDKSQTSAIEKAIRESDLGLNPQVDGDLIRIPIPPLSEERRKDLVKVARKQGEESKVVIRKARHEALDMLNEIKTEGHASEDDVERGKKKVEEWISESTASVDQIIQQKEKEILTI
ncbi:MAG TPA: ribosome recycling factor [Polyangiaceae bacterium]|nr:ribosome recycling factor [Polyangiaceae bacterium]